ncbi:MAG: hypothetical protein AB1782_14395 [Cyanobacteriota bacterium]
MISKIQIFKIYSCEESARMLNMIPLSQHNLLFASRKPDKQSFNSIYSIRNQPLADVVEFRGKKSKLEQFKELPKHEQQKIRNVVTSLLGGDPEVLLILNGSRPGALANVVFGPLEYPSPLKNKQLGILTPHWKLPKSSMDVFKKNKELLETKDLKILISNKTTYSNILFINLPKAREVVEKNLDLFRYKLDGPGLTTNQVMDIVMGENTPLFSNNYEDLLGIMLGFPAEDALVFNLYSQIDANARFMQKRGARVHQRVLTSLIPILRPDFWKFRDIKINGNDKTREVYNKFYEAFDIPVPESNMPAGSPIDFICWDSETKSMKELRENILENFQAVRERFQKPADVWNYLLTTK